MALDEVRIETPRLLLREFTVADTPALAAIEGDADVVRYLAFDARSPDVVRQKIDESIRDRAASPRSTFDLAVMLRTADAFIGRCGFAVRRPEHREAEIWWVFSPSARGQGYATEAATALLDFAFGAVGCHRVFADCDPRNLPSCALARRLGMKHEGRLRENYYLKGEWCDADIFGLLEAEWATRPAGGHASAGPPRNR